MMPRRLGSRLVWLALASAAGCGGGESAAPAPRAAPASTPTPASSSPVAAKPGSGREAAPAATESEAQKRFAGLSKTLEKGGVVDRGWLEKELKAILDLDAEFPAARFNLAVLKARDGDLGGAREAYQAILEDAPDFAPAAENLAAFYVADGKRDEAARVYRRVIEENPKDVVGRLALARLLTDSKQYAEAIALARQALQHQADAIEAFRVLAESYEATGNTAMAELIIGRGFKVAKDDVQLHYLTAKILLDKGELRAGVTKLKEVVALDPRWLRVRAQLAEIAIKYRDFGNASQQLETILKEDPRNRPARLALAVAYKGMGRFEQAEKLYQELLAADRNDAPALWNVAVLYHRHLNRYDDAIAAYKRYKGAAPGGDEKAGEVDKLVAEIDRVKNDIAATKAREERERRKLEAIEAACAAARQGKKPNAEAIGNDQERVEVAWQLMVDAQTAAQNGDVPAAEALVACAFGITPETPGAKVEACAPMRLMWTQILYQLGRLEDAMANTREARQCDPNNPDAQLIEQQLKDIMAQQGLSPPAGAAEPQPTAPAEAKPQGGKKRRGR